MTISNDLNYTNETLLDHLEQGFSDYFQASKKTNLPLYFDDVDGIIFLHSTPIGGAYLVIIAITDDGITLSKNPKLSPPYNLEFILESLAEYITNP